MIVIQMECRMGGTLFFGLVGISYQAKSVPLKMRLLRQLKLLL